MSRRATSFLIAVAIVAIVAILFYSLDFGLRTQPVERTTQQNRGADAPLEQVPSPGTIEDPNGNTQIPNRE